MVFPLLRHALIPFSVAFTLRPQCSLRIANYFLILKYLFSFPHENLLFPMKTYFFPMKIYSFPLKMYFFKTCSFSQNSLFLIQIFFPQSDQFFLSSPQFFSLHFFIDPQNSDVTYISPSRIFHYNQRFVLINSPFRELYHHV